MSTAVYYTHPNMNTSEDNNRHTLPSLSQIMPPPQHQQTSIQNDSTSPLISNGFYTQHLQQTQPIQQQSGYIDPYSQISTAQTTPTNSYTGFENSNNNNNNNNGNVIPQQSSFNSPTESSNDGNGNNNQHQCICKTNPNKIPRPRNAFILFRQKFHQTVLDEGSVIRTNPEVSRELGRRWRSLTSIEKQHWNNLAEEEKKNHALKYPDYKYAPRRNGKNKNCLVCKDKITPPNSNVSNSKQLLKEQLKANKLAAKKQAQVQSQAQQVQQQIQLQRHHSEAALAASNVLLANSNNHLSNQFQTQDIFKNQLYTNNTTIGNYNNNNTNNNNASGNGSSSNFIYPPQPYHYTSGTNGSLSASSTTSSSSTTNLPLPNNYNFIQQQQQQPTSATSLTSLQFYDHDKLSPLSQQQQQQQAAAAAANGEASATTTVTAQPIQNHYTAPHLGSTTTAGPVDYSLHPQHQQQQHHQQPYFQSAPPPPVLQHNTGAYGFDNFHQ
ncbi:RFG1 [Candida pseudojiufengensis]|uniref:RFG1 n=1 Tax=Candida pseudojiufengensis TaxID=497109 RepID=UPI0022243325|nr:RFG1 [Candida pseudojiufengensis]KAI5963491.1 RFG1 [Candida pseudojiufengensis]